MNNKGLIIDASTDLQATVRRHLTAEPVELFSAHTGELGLRLAAVLRPDVILLDVDLPDPGGFEVCRRLKLDPQTMNVPVLFLTGAASTAQKLEGLSLGAVDYVTKPIDPVELCARVRVALRVKQMADLLARRAMIDAVTGLWDRGYLDQRLEQEASLSARTRRPLACVLADVDHFKRVNDGHGHAAGDQVLRSVAQVLTHECRREDVVCRYGGEAFMVLTPGVGSGGAAVLAERLRDRVAGGAALRGPAGELRVTCSFGVAEYVPSPDPRFNLTRLAENALAQAKSEGRNRVVRSRVEESVAQLAPPAPPAARRRRDAA